MRTTAPGITLSFIVCSTEAETLATYAGSAPVDAPIDPDTAAPEAAAPDAAAPDDVVLPAGEFDEVQPLIPISPTASTIAVKRLRFMSSPLGFREIAGRGPVGWERSAARCGQ